MQLYVIGSSVLTNFGRFSYQRIEEHEALAWLQIHHGVWRSVMGHPETAAFMSERLSVHIPHRRRSIQMVPGDEALVLRPLRRLPDGCSLSAFEIQHFPCEFALLRMELGQTSGRNDVPNQLPKSGGAREACSGG